MKDDRERLLHILDALDRIEKYATEGRARFDQDELAQTWVVHHIQIVGEAAARLPPALRAAHPEIPWPQIIAMRNIVVHAYFSVDLDEVWATVDRDVPKLKTQIAQIIKGTPPVERAGSA